MGQRDRLKTFHIIEVTYVAAGNFHSSKTRLHSDRFRKTITRAYDQEYNDVGDHAADILKELGFHIVGYGEMTNGYYFVTDTFKTL